VTRPAHHRPAGGFRNPWPTDESHGLGDFLRWTVVERLAGRRPPGISRADFAAAFPPVAPAPALPRAAPDRLLATWVGHSTFLLQVGGLNVLTDPVWGERASPVPFAGPKRWAPPGLDFDALPPIDLVLVSHDHYDHLDEPTVRRLVQRDPRARWLAPLGVAPWIQRRGALVEEGDWWETASIGGAALTCVPAQHFSGRRATNRNETLWCGWTIRAGERSVYYVGDTGYFPDIADAARRGGGPFDLVLMPVGAYDPRWFMRPVHNDPADAVRAYQELAAALPGPPAVMAGMHWGTFKLTDESMDDPPRRTRAAWAAAGLPAELLWMPAHGETREL
jgi:N-acyl-phosphatidylethanolamine-hydrolysing phospholipase D